MRGSPVVMEQGRSLALHYWCLISPKQVSMRQCRVLSSMRGIVGGQAAAMFASEWLD